MNTTFGPITQPHIRSTLEENKTRVLALLIFYETRKNPRKVFKMLSYIIIPYSITMFLLIIYLVIKKI